ncbi:MAG: DNA polymerase III subunit delta [Firmicutes bacterium]|nr:DNA polymerase III subunit delta [Bacillota bacterium]
MAYQTKQSQPIEHPFRTVRRVMLAAKETGVYPRVMLLCGEEGFLIQWACGFVKELVVEPAVEALDYIRLSEDEVTPASILSACETLPFLSCKKLVQVDADPLFASSKEEGDAQKQVAEYLAKLPDSTLLLLVAPKAIKNRSLYKAAEKHGLVFDFTPLDDATLKGWLSKRLAMYQKTCDQTMLLNFVKANGYGDKEAGYDLYSVENDLKKVTALAEGSEITRKDLIEIYAPPANTNAFRLLDSAFSGNKEEAYRILSDTIDLQKASQVMGTVLQFTGLLCSQLEIMVEGLERRAEGQDFDTIARETGTNPYRLKKALEAASRRSLPALRDCLYRAYQIEKDLKNGIMEPRLSLELFIAGL